MADACLLIERRKPIMETIEIDENATNQTPFVIDVNFKIRKLGISYFKTYSTLIEPQKQKTVWDVMNKMKYLFTIKGKFCCISGNESILPKRETVEILRYLPKIRIQYYDNDNDKRPALLPELNDEEFSVFKTYQKSSSNELKCNGSEQNNVEDDKKTLNGSGRHVKSFCVGDFLANLRGNSDENEPNNSINDDMNVSLPVTEQEDCPRKRKRTRRRKPKDCSLEESEPTQSTIKIVGIHSCGHTADEKSKHLRFPDDDSLEEKQNALIAYQNVTYPLKEEVETSQLQALMSLRQQTPIVYVRAPSVSEKA